MLSDSEEQDLVSEIFDLTGTKVGIIIFHLDAQRYAEAEGWTFIWYPGVSWEVIGNIDLTRYKNADEGVEDIITGLREEGKAVKYRVSEGNKIMEILWERRCERSQCAAQQIPP